MRQVDKNDSSFSNIEKLNNELQNVKLDSNPKVSVYFETDSKKMTTSPSLNNYFGANEQSDNLQVVNFGSANSSKTSDTVDATATSSSKSEPVVCRIFAETPQPKKSVDPTSSFFDTIMQPDPPSTANSSGFILDMGLNNYNNEVFFF